MHKDCCTSAFKLLSLREHSQQELTLKLQQRGFSEETIQATLLQLQADNYQNDARFAACYIRARSARGCGPLRIQRELQQRGVGADVITTAFAKVEVDWLALLKEVQQKKFGSQPPQDLKAKSQQIRFLTYRGFEHELIQAAFKVS